MGKDGAGLAAKNAKSTEIGTGKRGFINREQGKRSWDSARGNGFPASNWSAPVSGGSPFPRGGGQPVPAAYLLPKLITDHSSLVTRPFSLLLSTFDAPAIPPHNRFTLNG